MCNKMMRFTPATESNVAARIEYCVKSVFFRLHRIKSLGDSLFNNTRHASVDFGYHAHPGGLLFMGVW